MPRRRPWARRALPACPACWRSWGGWQAAVLAAVFMALCFAVMLAIGFARRARFYRELAGLSAQKAGPGNLGVPFRRARFPRGPAGMAGARRAGPCRSRRDNRPQAAEQGVSRLRGAVDPRDRRRPSPRRSRSWQPTCTAPWPTQAQAGSSTASMSQVEQALYYARSTVARRRTTPSAETALADAVPAKPVRKNARYLIEKQAVPRVDGPAWRTTRRCSRTRTWLVRSS